ncbi:MAG: ABC transporter ATP-binding protein [Bacteroidota bacterium]
MVTSRSPAARIVVEGLTKRYQEGDQTRTVLNQLEAVFEPGELVILLGRSGAGKSTLLNLLSGIDLPSEGRVCIGDTDLTQLTEEERTRFRRDHIGFIFQAFNLIPTLTVEENLLLPLDLKGTRTPEREAAILDLLEAVGLRDRADSFPDRLSGGEQQRVAIARALSHEPDLILADEPTGNLDVHTGQQVMALLEDLVRQAGRTLLIVTHDRDLLAHADRILSLREGKLWPEATVPSSR